MPRQRNDGGAGSMVPEPAGAEAGSQGVGVVVVTWFAGGNPERKTEEKSVMVGNISGPL